jgi:hypothetical protein
MDTVAKRVCVRLSRGSLHGNVALYFIVICFANIKNITDAHYLHPTLNPRHPVTHLPDAALDTLTLKTVFIIFSVVPYLFHLTCIAAWYEGRHILSNLSFCGSVLMKFWFQGTFAEKLMC